MKVRFYVLSDESDIYEVPDNTKHDELVEEALDWLNNNADFGYEIVTDEDDI